LSRRRRDYTASLYFVWVRVLSAMLCARRKSRPRVANVLSVGLILGVRTCQIPGPARGLPCLSARFGLRTCQIPGPARGLPCLVLSVQSGITSPTELLDARPSATRQGNDAVLWYGEHDLRYICLVSASEQIALRWRPAWPVPLAPARSACYSQPWPESPAQTCRPSIGWPRTIGRWVPCGESTQASATHPGSGANSASTCCAAGWLSITSFGPGFVAKTFAE
jgi:hypothetical protein